MDDRRDEGAAEDGGKECVARDGDDGVLSLLLVPAPRVLFVATDATAWSVVPCSLARMSPWKAWR